MNSRETTKVTAVDSFGFVVKQGACRAGYVCCQGTVYRRLWSSYAVNTYIFRFHLLLIENCQIGLPRNKIIQVAADLGHHSRE